MTCIKWTSFIIWAKIIKVDLLFWIKPKMYWLIKLMPISTATITCTSFKFKWSRKWEVMSLSWILLPMFKELETAILNLRLPKEIYKKAKNIVQRDNSNFSQSTLVRLLTFVTDLLNLYCQRRLKRKSMLEETTLNKYLKI